MFFQWRGGLCVFKFEFFHKCKKLQFLNSAHSYFREFVLYEEKCPRKVKFVIFCKKSYPPLVNTQHWILEAAQSLHGKIYDRRTLFLKLSLGYYSINVLIYKDPSVMSQLIKSKNSCFLPPSPQENAFILMSFLSFTRKLLN